MGAPVTTVLGTVFRGADLESQLNLLARRAGEALPATSLADTTKKVRCESNFWLNGSNSSRADVLPATSLADTKKGCC